MQKKDLKIKAKELEEMFMPLVDCGDNRYTTKVQKQNAKQCALISIENSIKELMWLNLLCNFDNIMKINFNHRISELQDIKKEIEKL